MIRRLLRSERGKIAGHLKRLDAADRHLRFEIFATDTFIDNYVKGIRFATDVVYGAFDDNLVMRGMVHIAFAVDIAEVGLSVESTFRGGGIGTKMLDKAIRIARLRRTKTFTSMCLSNNRWMMKAMRERGFDIVRDHDTAIATTELSPPDLMTLGAEMADENEAWRDYARKFWFRLRQSES